MPDQRKCIRCGHKPCPGCEIWCDAVFFGAVCENEQCSAYAIAHLSAYDHEDTPKSWGIKIEQSKVEGDLSVTVECPRCGLMNKLGREDFEPELCCDGECAFEEPDRK